MYLDHFELNEAPFSITPDPRFVYLTSQHQDALAHLLFGISQGGGGGFVQLTGEVGTGKTTLCRLLMAQVPDNVRIALVLNPMQQPIELLRTICDELRILLPKRTSSIKTLTDALTRYLLESYAAGLRVVLIIDEAQNLSFESLEQVRMLTNLETPTQKLLQVILLGQPELRELLARDNLRQLAQRITARFHLAPLSAEDTAAYVQHRLAVAGRKRLLFTTDAMRELHRRTRGFPRAINVVADRALLGGYARAREMIDASMVAVAADEVTGNSPLRPRTFQMAAWLVVSVAAVAAVFVAIRWMTQSPVPVHDEPAVVATKHSDAPVRTTTSPPLAGFDTAASAANVIAGWWGSPGLVSERHCREAAGEGTVCARLRMNEAMLRQLDRPVAIELRDQDGRAWYALRRLLGDNAQLAGPARLTERSWGAIDANWVGDALMVAASPSFYDGNALAVGAVGPPIEFIHESLAEFDRETTLDPSRFTGETTLRIRRLQDRFGLLDDGIVGPETMALLIALQPGGPRLSDATGSGAFVSVPQQ